MADSEDENERRRRDKFRRERSDFQDRREIRNREDWEDRPRDNWKGRVRKEPFRDFDRRERYPVVHLEREYSPQQPNPHVKRIRREWDDPYYHFSHANSHFHQGPIHPHYTYHDFPNTSLPPLIPSLSVNHRNETNDGDQSGMLSFKEYLLQQDDGIDPEEAIKKYKDYKTQYQKTIIYDFFQAHKEEEWFKNKYHPDDCIKANLEKETKVKNRLKVFMEFYNKGLIDKFSLDQDQLKEIVKFLDAVIIKLEGGSDSDIKYLDDEYASAIVLTEEASVIDGKAKIDEFDPEVMDMNEIKVNSDKADIKAKGKKAIKDKGKKKIAHEDGNESGSSSSSKSSSSSASSGASSHSSSSSDTSSNKDNVDDKMTNGNKSPIEEGETKVEDGDKKILTSEPASTKSRANSSSLNPVSYHRTSSIFLRNLPPNVTRTEVENLCKDYPGYLRVALADPLPERKFYRRGWITFNRDANVKDICASLSNTKIKDCDMGPIVNRDIIRRVRLVNGIVCHKIIVKRDISLACRLVDFLDSKFNLWTEKEIDKGEKQFSDLDTPKSCGDHSEGEIVSNDLNQASKNEETEKNANTATEIEKISSLLDLPNDVPLESYGTIQFKNPLLKNMLDDLLSYLKSEREDLELVQSKEADSQNEKDNVLEEGEERSDDKTMTNLLKVSNDNKSITPVEREDKINKLLDKLILYLRIVHSMDYYSISEYPNEDDMPNKCGIIHCRGALTQNKIFSKDVCDWIKNFEVKIKAFISPTNGLTDKEAIEIGLQNYETEIEKFVKTNSQELAKDKWLCPLSGKKFKGPDFVRKHIFNKHPERIDQVKKEVDFFNNYLMDVKRPHNLNNSSSTSAVNQANNAIKSSLIIKNVGGHQHHPHHPPNYNFNHQVHPANTYTEYSRNYYQHPYPMRGGNEYERNMYPKKRSAGGSREIIQYRDLDAPEETEIF